ncbi:TraE/TraK family type IV conjugative transfer system protein [Candidatus Jidaibacter acanthamoebae]|nr:TraE/TraK family type IV conjugative transfer system protein [Candidatus Jidaibacter acanthamoeba]
MEVVNSKLRLQRNVLVLCMATMLISNVMLAVKLNNQEKIVILVPTLDKELAVGTGFVSEEYLKLRAEQIIYLLFSLRKENIEYVKQGLLKQIDSQSYQEFKAQLEKLSLDIKERGYFYIFNDIQKFEIDSKDLNVKVSGYLETYLGNSRIDRKFKEYEVSFVNRGGVVNLKSFSEVKNEKNS